MSLVTEKQHVQRLKKQGITVKTKYKTDGGIIENSEDEINDIENAIKLEKSYYKDGYLIGKLHGFDSRIEYTKIKPKEKQFKCPNCGMKVDKYENGCPYCRTTFNIDYTEKRLNDKSHYDYILHSSKYIITTLLMDILVSFILVFIYIKATSRTFNEYDISKIIVFTVLLSSALYYAFYLLDSYILFGWIKRYKEKQNQKSITFWKNTDIDKNIFFNNINFELEKYYYNKYKDIIDFDIIDYNTFETLETDGKRHVKVNIILRLVKYESKIKTEVITNDYTFIEVPKEEKNKNGDLDIIKCRRCGASLDITKNICDFCKIEYNYYQSWYLEKVEEQK